MICLSKKQEQSAIYKFPAAAMHLISKMYSSELPIKHAVHTNINKDFTTIAFNERTFSNPGLLKQVAKHKISTLRTI